MNDKSVETVKDTSMFWDWKVSENGDVADKLATKEMKLVCWTISEKAMAPHSSTLAWKIQQTEEPGRLQSMGLLRVGHDWATSLSLFTFTHSRRKWQPTPLFLPENPRDGGAWWAAVYGVAQSRTQLKWLSSSSSLNLESQVSMLRFQSHDGLWPVCVSAKSLQSCLTLCDPMDCSPPGSMGFSRQEYWSGLPCPPPGDLPHPGIESTSLISAALAGCFFTTSTTWEALKFSVWVCFFFNLQW